ncbi:MAG: transcriptional regulator [Pseudonocardiales bacterium]|nr:transcriptional regulator [Pseudonocardiales bacterium]
MIEQLRLRSEEFATLWDLHEVGLKQQSRKTIVHAELGEIELDCQELQTENLAQSLLVFTATPGTEGYERRALLAVIGRSLA